MDGNRIAFPSVRENQEGRAVRVQDAGAVDELRGRVFG